MKHSPAKTRRDIIREIIYNEKRRVFSEAYKDYTDSIGEIDSRTNSRLLDIHPGEVLHDPKLRYVHPRLRRVQD